MDRLLILLCLLAGKTAAVWAHQPGRYSTQLLQRMATQLKISEQLDTLSTGCYYGFTYHEGLPVTVIVRAGRIEHIGFAVFAPQQREVFPSPVYNFIERYALDARLPQELPISESRRLELDHIVFSQGSLALLPTLYGDTTVTFSIGHHEERAYTAEWKRGDEVLCSMFFPANYELLHGSRLIENENRLRADIEQFADTLPTPAVYPIDAAQAVDSMGYYVLDYGHNRIPQMANKRYLRLCANTTDTGGILQAFCSAHYPVESVANLFSCLDISNHYIAQVKMLKYSFQQERFSVPLSQLVGTMLDEGCKPYFGLIDYDEQTGMIDAVIEMRNHEQAYEHVMRIKMDCHTLASRQGSIAVTLMAYIMTHNVKSM